MRKIEIIETSIKELSALQKLRIFRYADGFSINEFAKNGSGNIKIVNRTKLGVTDDETGEIITRYVYELSTGDICYTGSKSFDDSLEDFLLTFGDFPITVVPTLKLSREGKDFLYAGVPTELDTSC